MGELKKLTDKKAAYPLPCKNQIGAVTPLNSRRELVWCRHAAHDADLA